MGFSKNKITTDYTKQLCKFIKETEFEQLPPAVVERAKMHVMQTIGVCLCSTELQLYKNAATIAKELSGGSGEGVATLWGDGAKVSWEAAGFAAGAMGDLLDWEDCSVTGHPSAGVIPTAVITSQVFKKSGKELLTAAVLGYEVYQRIALAGRTNIVSYNIFGVLTVIMKLLGFTEEQMNRCFGIGTACSIIPVNVHETTMSDSLKYLYGYKLENAITMAKSALLGIEGMQNAFDDPTAYFKHVHGANQEWLTKELGEKFMLMDILIKHWPANMFVQTYAELAYRVVTNNNINPDNIKEIVLRPSVQFRHYYSDVGYKSMTQAQFSIPYCVACVMYNREPGAIWYKPETMTDPKILTLMKKIVADGFVDMTFPGRKVSIHLIKNLIEGHHPEKNIIVTMKDGSVFTESLFTHPGHPSYMLTRDEFKARFRLETKNIMPLEKAEEIINIIQNLEKYEDASVLGELLG